MNAIVYIYSINLVINILFTIKDVFHQLFINSLETGGCCDSLIIISNEDTFLQDFLEILKRMLQNF